jgi:hypothetical protein
LVTVTVAPLWVSTPFQIDEMVWPLAKLQTSVQLVQAVLLVLVMATVAPKAVELCGVIV